MTSLAGRGPRPRRGRHGEHVPRVAGGRVEGGDLLEQARRTSSPRRGRGCCSPSRRRCPARPSTPAARRSPMRAGPEDELHVRARAVGHRRAGLRRGARSRGRRARRSAPPRSRSPGCPAGTNSSQRTAPEALERLLRPPRSTPRSGCGCRCRTPRPGPDRAAERLGGAVEEVLEADPGAHPPVGTRCGGSSSAAVRLERSRSSRSPRLVGHVGHEGGPDAELVGDRGRALHEPPHVHHRRGAGQQRLGVAQRGWRPRRSPGSAPGGPGRRRPPASPTATSTRPCPAAGRSGGGSCAARAARRGR